MKPITSLENSELIAKIYESNKLTDNFKTPPKMIKYVGNLTPPGL